MYAGSSSPAAHWKLLQAALYPRRAFTASSLNSLTSRTPFGADRDKNAASRISREKLLDGALLVSTKPPVRRHHTEAR